ncbi:hypothetical protein K402DRAFT_453280 [Aulographum hederae CBS 113979]|uniref:Myb-like domain-containing protein n=1 Tax=Aulographum hederae CBS 113979 TaxID=1176131 RepID=A0A6G1H535_9PEZI|nr:hypothetical protein K402DRAFT_453280 [Aulographum hederae CBS 113979]
MARYGLRSGGPSAPAATAALPVPLEDSSHADTSVWSSPDPLSPSFKLEKAPRPVFGGKSVWKGQDFYEREMMVGKEKAWREACMRRDMKSSEDGEEEFSGVDEAGLEVEGQEQNDDDDDDDDDEHEIPRSLSLSPFPVLNSPSPSPASLASPSSPAPPILSLFPRSAVPSAFPPPVNASSEDRRSSSESKGPSSPGLMASSSQAAAASSFSPVTEKKTITTRSGSGYLQKKPAGWSGEEAKKLFAIMKKLVPVWSAEPSRKMNDLWSTASDELDTQYHIKRRPGAIKNFWSRNGRAEFDLDERRKPTSDLKTSIQKPAAEMKYQKRKSEELETDDDDDDEKEAAAPAKKRNTLNPRGTKRKQQQQPVVVVEDSEEQDANPDNHHNVLTTEHTIKEVARKEVARKEAEAKEALRKMTAKKGENDEEFAARLALEESRSTRRRR